MEKAYETRSYDTEFDAVVTATEQIDGTVWVMLDTTLFFPLEGGQSPDRGILGGCPVTDVQIQNGIIRHAVSVPEGAAAFAEGQTVHGTIDWNYRYRNMQMHSGEHIFSGLVHNRFGYDNVGFHLSDNSATMDYNGRITEEELRELERKANEVIVENHAIRAWYPTAEELETLSYRSKKELREAVRLVEIEGVDLCACCVPHVRSTGEVGCFKITDWENYKGGVRIQYRCGFRAMEDYEDRIALLKTLSQQLSVKQNQLSAAVERMKNENRTLQFELISAERETILRSIREMAAKDGYTDGGERLNRSAVLWPESRDASILRFAANELKQRYAGTIAVFLKTESGYRYLLEREGGTVAALNTALRNELGAKGGGSAESVQGSVAAEKETLQTFLAGREEF